MDVKTYKCPNCSADMKFNPDNQLFYCEYCRGQFTHQQVISMAQQINEGKQDAQRQAGGTQDNKNPASQNGGAGQYEGSNDTSEGSGTNDAQDQEFAENTRLYQCPSCGAEIVSDMNTAASFCYYCHNPVILKGRVEGMYRPSKVLPFAFGRDKAVDYFNGWAGKKRYVPNDLISEKQIEKMTGLYVPFWVADAVTRSRMTAKGETIRKWTSGNYEYTQTKVFDVVRDLNVEYGGVPADGSLKIEDDLMESIEPFDYRQAKDFDMAYLSGFLADKYDVDKEAVYGRIQQRMFENNRAAIESSCGYDRMVGKEYGEWVTNLRWNYMLLPVWFMTFHYKGKVWEYAINGQTGKIAGELPIDENKMRIHLAVLIAVTTLIVMVLGYLGGLLL